MLLIRDSQPAPLRGAGLYQSGRKSVTLYPVAGNSAALAEETQSRIRLRMFGEQVWLNGPCARQTLLQARKVIPQIRCPKKRPQRGGAGAVLLRDCAGGEPARF